MVDYGNSRDSKKFAFLDDIEELPSLPQVLVGISRVASDPKSGATDLANIILKDQAMTLKILRISNSAQYAMFDKKITTVSKAVVVLGFESVRAIALSVEMYRVLSSLVKAGAVLEDFWKKAISVAVISQEMSIFLNLEVPEEAFVAGLLHDMGKLILAEHKPEKAAVVYTSGLSGPALTDAEIGAFGMTSKEVAAELGRRWEMPEVIMSAILNHGQHFDALPEDRGDQMAFVIGVAKTLAVPLLDPAVDNKQLAFKMARVVRKPVGQFLEMLQTLPPKIQDFATFFEIQVEDLKIYTLWVEDENRRLKETYENREETRRTKEKQQELIAFMQNTNSELLHDGDPDNIAKKCVEAISSIVGSKRVVAAIFNQTSARAERIWSAGDVDPAFLESFQRIAGDQGVIGQTMWNGEPVHVIDTKMPYFKRLMTAKETRTLNVPSFSTLPLVLKDKTKTGVLYADRDEGDEPFSDEEIQSLVTITDLICLALKTK